MAYVPKRIQRPKRKKEETQKALTYRTSTETGTDSGVDVILCPSLHVIRETCIFDQFKCTNEQALIEVASGKKMS